MQIASFITAAVLATTAAAAPAADIAARDRIVIMYVELYGGAGMVWEEAVGATGNWIPVNPNKVAISRIRHSPSYGSQGIDCTAKAGDRKFSMVSSYLPTTSSNTPMTELVIGPPEVITDVSCKLR